MSDGASVGPGSSPTGQAPAGLAASRVDPSRKMADSWFRAQTRSTTMAFIAASHQRRDYPLGEGERALGWFVLPPFQRPAVWTEAQQVRFIESCWLGLPIGVFIYNRTKADGPLDSWLLDGQQRVTAIHAYMADQFPVMGYRFSELSRTDLRRWDMSISFPCMETNLEDLDQLREVYDRLAYGGTPHKPKNDSDTHPQGGDSEAAPFMGSAGRKASPDPSTPSIASQGKDRNGGEG